MISSTSKLMKTELAEYILCLSENLALTRHANDRPLYEKYLADAAVLLALVERGINVEELHQRIENHERLLSNTWLVGGEHKSVFKAWNKFKGLF
jgi:hypothetical protein